MINARQFNGDTPDTVTNVLVTNVSRRSAETSKTPQSSSVVSLRRRCGAPAGRAGGESRAERSERAETSGTPGNSPFCDAVTAGRKLSETDANLQNPEPDFP
jgi:hypothetical protein